MPLPPRDHAKRVTAAVEGVLRSVTRLVGTVEDAVSRRATPALKGTTEKGRKLQKSLRAYWARMKGKAREQRVAVMLKGRGIKPKRR